MLGLFKQVVNTNLPHALDKTIGSGNKRQLQVPV